MAFEKFKMLIGLEDIEDYDDDDEEVVEAEAVRGARVEAAKAAPAVRQPNAIEKRPQAPYAGKDRSSNFVQPKMDLNKKDNKVINMQTNGPTKKQFKLVVTEPKSFDDCPKLVNNLKNNKPVIINLEKVETEKARKIFDFLSGATYALDGVVQKVANNIFIFAPTSVDITSPQDIEHHSTFSSPWSR